METNSRVENFKFEKMTIQETSDYTGVPVKTLAYWRCMYPEKLAYLKVGKNVYYNRYDVNEFLMKSIKGGEECMSA